MNPSVRGQAWVILVTQWRIWLNFYRRNGRVALALSVLFSAIWYGGFAGIAVFLASVCAQPSMIEGVGRGMSVGLFFVFLYWQGMPLLMASVGGLLDLKKLMVYPVPEKSFYRIELLLRTAMFCEMPILMAGTAVGLLRNPALPKWAALGPVLFAIFNITLSAGIKDLLARLLARKRVREIALLLVVLLAALPSFLASRGLPGNWKQYARAIPTEWLPWSAAAQVSTAQEGWIPWVVLVALSLAAWGFGRAQFRRSIQFDSDSSRASESRDSKRRFEWLYTWPGALLGDPLGALVEKELRFVSRVTRFRIVFFMGFSFGLLIWLPLATRPGAGGWMSGNFLSVVSAYALVLLSEVCFYNAFGFDRSAAQMYFLAPVRPSVVVAAKNIAAVIFVVVEVAFVTSACAILRMPLTAGKIAEAACVSAVMTLFFLGIGNIGSTRLPRGQNPNDGWRRAGGSKVSLLAILAYPLIALPIALSYAARWAFESEAAFYAAIAAALFIAACFYAVSVSSAVETMERQRERFLSLLTQSDAPAV